MSFGEGNTQMLLKKTKAQSQRFTELAVVSWNVSWEFEGKMPRVTNEIARVSIQGLLTTIVHFIRPSIHMNTETFCPNEFGMSLHVQRSSLLVVC